MPFPERNPPTSRPSRTAKGLSTWLIVVAIALVMLLSNAGLTGRDTITYSEFKALVAAHLVDSLLIAESRINGSLALNGLERALPAPRAAELRAKGGANARRRPFSVARIDDPSLVADLERANVRYEGVVSTWMDDALTWLLPLVLLFFLWSSFFRRFGPQSGIAAIGRSRAKVYAERTTGVTFADVAGLDEARAELMEIVDFLKNPDRYRSLGGKIPKGVLLVGAPGTGKTLMAKALAGEARVPFFSLTGSEFVEMFVGVGAARVRDLFVQAQANAPCIIFIDELDALGRVRSVASIVGSHEEREQTLNQLLAEMDGFDTQKGVIILAATNRPEILDPALLRPGRFDRKIVLDLPDVRGREQILRVHTRTVILAPDVDLDDVAASTPGFAGADLANLVNEAALAAARAGKPAVTSAEFDTAIDRVVAGLERKSRVMTPREKRIVACHEAGHALIAELRPTADRVTRVSIIPHGAVALGYTRQQPTDDRYVLTRTELLDRLDVMLGGRVGEEVALGEISTGACDDLQRASELARDMVMRFGMSEALGIVSYEGPRRAPYTDVLLPERREFSEGTSQEIDKQVRKLLDDARARVLATLRENRRALDAIANELVTREVIGRDRLRELLTPTAVEETAAPRRSYVATA